MSNTSKSPQHLPPSETLARYRTLLQDPGLDPHLREMYINYLTQARIPPPPRIDRDAFPPDLFPLFARLFEELETYSGPLPFPPESLPTSKEGNAVKPARECWETQDGNSPLDLPENYPDVRILNSTGQWPAPRAWPHGPYTSVKPDCSIRFLFYQIVFTASNGREKTPFSGGFSWQKTAVEVTPIASATTPYPYMFNVVFSRVELGPYYITGVHTVLQEIWENRSDRLMHELQNHRDWSEIEDWGEKHKTPFASAELRDYSLQSQIAMPVDALVRKFLLPLTYSAARQAFYLLLDEATPADRQRVHKEAPWIYGVGYPHNLPFSKSVYDFYRSTRKPLKDVLRRCVPTPREKLEAYAALNPHRYYGI